MASREEMIAYLKSQNPEKQSITPSREEMISFLKQKMDDSNKSSIEKAGEFLVDNVATPINDYVLSPIGTALDYTYAPIRQAMAFPAKRLSANSEAEALQAYKDIPGQLFRKPSEAPTTAQVLEMYGVKKEKDVSPFAVANPLMASTYENDPMPDDKNNVKIRPSAEGALIVDALAGGEGVNLAGKAIKGTANSIASGASKFQDLAAKKLIPNVKYTSIENPQVITEAAKKIGIENVPKALLTNNETYQKLESGLSQSGSIPASKIREQYNSFRESLKKASEKIENLKTEQSDFSIGKEIQSGLEKEIAASKAPVKELYGKIIPDLQKIPVDQSVVNKVIGQLKKDPIFKTKDGAAFLEEHKNILLDTPELSSLKELRTGLKGLVNNQSLPIDQARVNALRNAVTKIRDNSVNALKNSLPADAHSEIDALLNEIALADTAHAANVKDLNSIKSVVGNKNIDSSSEFLSKLSNMKEADVAERVGNLDVSSLTNLKEKFPNIFDKAKTAKINDMIKRSTNAASGFNENTFIKQYDNLDSEIKNLIFDPAMREHIESFKTVKQAIPAKLGPSGTPEGKMLMDMFNPKRTALDYGIKKALQSGEQATNVASQVIESKPYVPAVKTSAVNNVLNFKKPDQLRSSPMEVPSAADNNSDTPKKGPDKWANDGSKKLIDSGISPEIIEQLKNDKKGKQLLIEASDLTPGSKAMEGVMQKIRTGYLNKGD